MSKIQRINRFLMGLVVLVAGIAMIAYPNDSYVFVILFLSLGLLITGIGRLTYYFTMTRYMVGGKESLYRGIIFLDFALFTMSLSDVPKVYVLMYLALVHAFSGLVDILRAVEAKRYSSKNWRLKLFHGILNVVVAASCFIFINNPNTAGLVYGLGLVYSGLLRIASAFRRTTFIYIR
jgi:uncharacterized membrane protein HdeD (DUF308 family)